MEQVSSKNWGEVKRYDCKGGGIGSYCQGCYHMEQEELGDYVEFEDYFALQAEVAYQTDMACQASVANTALRAEVERLSRTLKEIAMRHCRCDRHDPTWLCSTCLAASALSPAAETPEQHKVDP